MSDQTEYTHDFAGTILKAYDECLFHASKLGEAEDDKYRDHHGAWCRALDSVVEHATGLSVASWDRDSLKEFMEADERLRLSL